jgi:hypothetical protein
MVKRFGLDMQQQSSTQQYTKIAGRKEDILRHCLHVAGNYLPAIRTSL